MLGIHKIAKGYAVVRSGAIIEREDMREIRFALEHLEDDAVGGIILDFSDCEHIYYRITDLLARHERWLSRRNGRLILTGLNDYLNSIFNFSGYNDRFERFDTVEEALGTIYD